MIECPDIPFALDESLSDQPDLLQLSNVIAMVIKPTLHSNWMRIFFDHPSKRVIFSSTFEGSLGIWGLGQLALHHSPHEAHGLGTLGSKSLILFPRPAAKIIAESIILVCDY